MHFQPTQAVEDLHKQLHALTEIAKTLTAPSELPELLKAVLDKIIGVIEPADVGTIMIWDQSAGLFRSEASFGFDQTILSQMGLRAGESVTGKTYDDGNARLISNREDVAEDMADMRAANRRILADALQSESLPTSTIAVPLFVRTEKFGVLVLETLREDARFTEEDIPFVQSIADLVALAIDRARLEARADAIREAQRAERLRSEVMATLSHQLRMPLSAIKGYSTALQLDEIDWSEAKTQEFLQYIETECNNMETMITELLDSSLIDVGQLTMERQPQRLQLLVAEIASEIQHHDQTHRFFVEFPPDFPIVDIDPRWIKQVFRNIIDNAIKYSPQGGLIVLRGEVRQKDVLVSIADQGIGISPEDLIPLFEKFFRVQTEKGVRVPGTGLGLPVARAVIEAHGGRIWAESKLGQGTIIYFTIPLPGPESQDDEQVGDAKT